MLSLPMSAARSACGKTKHPSAMGLTELRANCPYCWEPLTLLVDAGDLGVDYIEDCQVCCQPMIVSASADFEGDLSVSLRREDD